MRESCAVPRAVAEAALAEFAAPMTGVLYRPALEGFCLIGNVFHDQRRRFADGRLIRTSTVLRFVECSGYQIALTVSGSRYVLVSANGSDVRGLITGWFDATVHH